MAVGLPRTILEFIGNVPPRYMCYLRADAIISIRQQSDGRNGVLNFRGSSNLLKIIGYMLLTKIRPTSLCKYGVALVITYICMQGWITQSCTKKL